jgi:hypothetical protein
MADGPTRQPGGCPRGVTVTGRVRVALPRPRPSRGRARPERALRGYVGAVGLGRGRDQRCGEDACEDTVHFAHVIRLCSESFEGKR